MPEAKERPILFNGAMVRAVLDGRKTVTRRAVRPGFDPDDLEGTLSRSECRKLERELPQYFGPSYFCPYGQPGDRLWVRESGIYGQLLCPEDPSQPGTFRHDVPRTLDIGDWWIQQTRAPGASYNVHGNPRQVNKTKGEKAVPSIHMPRWACRILLEITGVRVERLQALSAEQALAEGVRRYDRHAEAGDWFHVEGVDDTYSADPVASFAQLWKATGGDWDANPWVWVVEFKRITP
ncbi:hypothetical protein D3C77_501070 [compost metagenome]